MHYSECKPIEARLATVWKVTFANGHQMLQIWCKEARIEQVVEHTKVLYPNSRFTVGIITVGEFNLDEKTPVVQSYSDDARKLNQDMELVLWLVQE